MKPDGPPLDRDFHSADGDLNHREDGQIWVAATEERVGFDMNPSAEARETLLSGAVSLMPAMKDAELVLHTACLRPLSPDWMPIIGNAPGWDNAYLATGAGKKGILISPGMGKAVADLITTGRHRYAHTRLRCRTDSLKTKPKSPRPRRADESSKNPFPLDGGRLGWG